MSKDTRLHTVDCGGKDSVNVMVYEPQFERIERTSISLSVQSGNGSASMRLTVSESRATAHLLLAAAEESERRNALCKSKEVE